MTLTFKERVNGVSKTNKPEWSKTTSTLDYIKDIMGLKDNVLVERMTIKESVDEPMRVSLDVVIVNEE